MIFTRFILLSALIGIFDLIVAVKIASFQDDEKQSDSHLLWKGKWKLKNDDSALTLCTRFKFSTLWETNCFLQFTHPDTKEDYGLHQPLGVVLDLQSLWYSVGGFRTRHKFSARFVALNWYHACVTYSHKFKEVVSYIDGVEQDSFKGETQYPVNGSNLKIGACTKTKSFHGEISQVNVWDRVLKVDEIAAIANCNSDDQGSLVSWDSDWEIIRGGVGIKDVDVRHFCEDTNGPNFFMFPAMPMGQAHAACKSITGELPVPESESELSLYRSVTNDTKRLPDEDCELYWVDATDIDGEGVWQRKNSDKNISLYWNKREPDGKDTENCAVMELTKSLGVFDTKCSEMACSICILQSRPIWSLMGSCEQYARNRYFVAIQSFDGQIIFKGYSDYQILQDSNDIWTWRDRKGNKTIATLAATDRTQDVGYYPFGRKKWKLSRPICDKLEGDEITVLLTPCKDNEFTCNDAYCIPLWQRCDLKPNCLDQSDEQNCRLIDIPLSYRADIPPLSTDEDTALPITLGVILESIDIHTADMRMHVNINLTMTWKDSRVQYRNLNKDRTLNRVKYDVMKEMWVPIIDFTNTRGNHITQADEEATMAVNMQSKPTFGSDSQPEEVEFYAGEKNSISIIRKYSETFQCHFDLSRYPFDEQICRMELTMLSASSRLLQFGTDSSAKFIGNTQLVEYTVEGVDVDIHNDLDFSVLFVEVGLVRRAGFILMNVYVPSLCLLIITYLTLYFKPAIFQVRVLATLTSLLVMTTLFTQASSHLPKTSYFKSVDVWLLTSLIIIFTVILCHIIIDRSIDDKPKLPFKSSLSKLIKRKQDSLPMTSVSPASGSGESGFQKMPNQQFPDSLDDEPREIPWSKYLIVSSRIFVLLGVMIFNIIYWTVALSVQKSKRSI